MATERPELSKKNRYWIPKDRYYELKHFCLQYNMWAKFYSKLDGWQEHHYMLSGVHSHSRCDVTAKTAEDRESYLDRMTLVQDAANQTDPVIGGYIFEAVTKGRTYEQLNAKYDIPCCRGTYYELYRKFFWLLDRSRK